MEFARVRQVQDAIDVIVAHTLFTDILTAQPLHMGVVTDVCGFAGNGAHFDADDYSTSMALTKSYRANGIFFVPGRGASNGVRELTASRRCRDLAVLFRTSPDGGIVRNTFLVRPGCFDVVDVCLGSVGLKTPKC